MIAKMLEVADEVEVIVGGKKPVIVSKDNLNIVELAKLFLGNTTPEDFIKTGKLDQDFSLKISKGEVKDVEIDGLKANFTVEKDVTKAKEEFHSHAKEIAEKMVEGQEVIDFIDYKNGKATVKLNADKLEDVNDMENLGTGLFSEILPSLGVKSVKIGNKEFTVDPKAENFNLNKMVSAALETVDSGTNTIKYSAKIVKNEMEFEEDFEVKFEFLGNETTKQKNEETLKVNIDELEGTAIKLLNQQGRFKLEKTPENKMNFTFLTKGNPGGILGLSHDKSLATAETSMENYTRGSGLATALGMKADKSGKEQKARVDAIKEFLELDTMTINGKKFEGINSIFSIYSMKVGDFLGEKTLKVKVKNTVGKDKDIEYTVNFMLSDEEVK